MRGASSTPTPSRFHFLTPTRSGLRRSLSLAFVLLAAACFVVTAIANHRAPVTFAETQPTQSNDQDYSSFSHRSARHASLECVSCHRRTPDNDARPAWPVHKACTSCHLAQFVTPNVPMCAICHADLKSSNAPLKTFPENFKESFNVRFDHAQHASGAARPANGCAACHAQPVRRGVALSIPAGLNAHNQCYACHTPDSRSSSGLNIGTCNTCHQAADYTPTPTNARAFRASFSHAEHGARQRLACADCHTLSAGLPQSKQVSAPRTAQHFPTTRTQSCMTCHNGKRAFGDELDFADCRRCHKAQTFRMAL